MISPVFYCAGHCPLCGSDDISWTDGPVDWADELDNEKEYASLDGTCGVCKAVFSEFGEVTYRFTKIRKESNTFP